MVKDAAAGLLMASELDHLGVLLASPERPFVAVLGGSKVSGKLAVLENLLGRVDTLLIGGAMAYTFFEARGYPTGRSLVEADLVDTTRQVESGAHEQHVSLRLPTDHVVADRLEAGSPHATIAVTDPAIGDRLGLDIGPDTRVVYVDIIANARHGRLERAHGRLRDRRICGRNDGGGTGCGRHDRRNGHRRWRFDRGRRQGRR